MFQLVKCVQWEAWKSSLNDTRTHQDTSKLGVNIILMCFGMFPWCLKSFPDTSFFAKKVTHTKVWPILARVLLFVVVRPPSPYFLLFYAYYLPIQIPKTRAWPGATLLFGKKWKFLRKIRNILDFLFFRIFLVCEVILEHKLAYSENILKKKSFILF